MNTPHTHPEPQPDITFRPLFKLTIENQEDLQLAACDTCGAIIAYNNNNTTWIIKHGQHHTQKDNNQ